MVLEPAGAGCRPVYPTQRAFTSLPLIDSMKIPAKLVKVNGLVPRSGATLGSNIGIGRTRGLVRQ